MQDRTEDCNQDQDGDQLPTEMKQLIFGLLPLSDLITIRLLAKSVLGLVDYIISRKIVFAQEAKKVIEALYYMDREEENEFIIFYQHTIFYQQLKNKLTNNETMTPEETICYTLTRDCNVLPPVEVIDDALKNVRLDENIKNYLSEVITSIYKMKCLSELISMCGKIINVDDFSNKKSQEYGQYYSHKYSSSYRSGDKLSLEIKLGKYLQANRSLFANLLVGNDLSHLYIDGIDFSYCNLRGVVFRGAELNKVDFTGARLVNIDFSGATLSNINFARARLKDVQFMQTTFGAVDFSANSLMNVDFEWIGFGSFTLLPADALTSEKIFSTCLQQFQQKLIYHSPLSRRKLQEKMLENIADEIKSSSMGYSEKITFLNIALSIIIPDSADTYIFPFQNACLKLKATLEDEQSPRVQEEKVEHPLREKANSAVLHILLFDDAKERGRHFNTLIDCIKQDPSLNTRDKITEAWGIDAEVWYTVMMMLNSYLKVLHFKMVPTLVDGYPFTFTGMDYCHIDKEPISENRCYASEVFTGESFLISHLQTISIKDLDEHLFKAEDFYICQEEGRTEKMTKLGDLFFTFQPGGKGSLYLRVEAIDFDHKKRNLLFVVDTGRYANVPVEAFVPFNPFINYNATNPGLKEINAGGVRKALRLKKQLIERILISEKINRRSIANLPPNDNEEVVEAEVNVSKKRKHTSSSTMFTARNVKQKTEHKSEPLTSVLSEWLARPQ